MFSLLRARNFISMIFFVGAGFSTILLLAINPADCQAAKRDITVVNHEYLGTKQWLPGTIVVDEGDEVNMTLINNTPSGVHGFQISDFNIKIDVKKGETKTISFKAEKAGIFPINCQLHKAHVGGQLVILKK